MTVEISGGNFIARPRQGRGGGCFGTTGLSEVSDFATAEARPGRPRGPTADHFRKDRIRTALVFAAIVVAAWHWAAHCRPGQTGTTAGIAQAPRNSPAPSSTGDSKGREGALQAWEKWLNQQPSSVLAVDFYGQSTWEDYSKYSWVPGIWKKLNPARNVVWSVPLTIKGTPLADVASGLHDTAFEAAARAIAEAHPRPSSGSAGR